MSKPTRSRSRRPNRRDASTQSFEFFTRPKQSFPVILLLMMWRWRWELIAITLGCLIYWKATEYGLPLWLVCTALLAMLAALLVVPPTRRFIRARTWCVITRHRLRSCMAEMRTLNYSGNLPLIMHAHGTKVGESVWLWMRPGLSVTDLENRAEHLASACWARDARIQRNRKMAALVRIDIVRRDPLAASTIASPLLDSSAKLPSSSLPDGPALSVVPNDDIRSSSSTDSKSEEAPRRTTSKTKKSTAMTADAAPAVLLNGEDVSDYV